jgi:hypothetical protein
METTILLTVLGIIITVLVAVLGWLVVRSYRMRDRKEDRLVEVTDQLLKSQHRLDTTVVKLSENIMAQIDICKLKHTPIEARLGRHRSLLEKHEKQLIDLEKKLIKINGIK